LRMLIVRIIEITLAPRKRRAARAVRWRMAIAREVTAEDTAVDALCARIDAFMRLGPNWDGEDAHPITRDTVKRAKALLEYVARSARNRGVRWAEPSVSPNSDGGVDISWDLAGHWVMLSVSPARTEID